MKIFRRKRRGGLSRFIQEHGDDIIIGIATGLITNLITEAFERTRKNVEEAPAGRKTAG